MIVRTSALTMVLFGARSMHVRAAGCYPAWSGGGSYNSGSVVSNSETKSSTSVKSCTGTSNGCSGGYRTVTTTTTTSTNYVCVNNANSAFCGSYQPGSHGGSIAWSSTGTCDGDAPAPVIPTPSPWGKGCPGAFVAGSDYASADVVSVSRGTHTEVFECASPPMNLFCGQSGYEPATGQYYQGVWTSKGSCSGTMAPTDSPSFDTLEDAGGCPGAYSEGEAYDEGDKVSLDGFVYECNPNPNGLFCSNAAYAPGVDIPGGAVTPYWKTAWSIKGYCDGTITPTVSPSFDSLQNLGGCPPEWELKVHPEEYEEGQTAAVGELVFRCKTYPASGWCGQAGYKPMDETAGHQDAWKNAWQLAGYCDGSMGPTVSPSFDPENVIGACPDEWEAKVHPLKYEEGEMVAVTVSEDPERKYAYRCKAFPFDGYCGQFAPNVWGGSQGWILAGACDGSVGPTASPVFVSLNIIGDSCPEEFDLGKMDYAYGDQVSVAVNADQKIVYECKNWPHGDHCKSSADNIRDPTAEFGYMGWSLKGGCEGTIAPTPAPSPYNNSGNTCTYTKTVITTNCSPGSSGCSCTTDSAPGTYCTKTTTTTPNVNNYSPGASYDKSDVVRINGNKRYKCNVAGWCSMESYKPDGKYGSHAWSPDGTCHVSAADPTPGPTPEPTPAPVLLTLTAVHDGVLGAPKCGDVGMSCFASANLLAYKGKPLEPNYPNTLDNCEDGTSNTNWVKSIMVSAQGGQLKAGQPALIEAEVNVHNSYVDSFVDYYYANDANSPVWSFIRTLEPSMGGSQTMPAVEFTLPEGTLQAVRVNIRYKGTQGGVSGGGGTCSVGGSNSDDGGWRDDVDDLVFAVAP